MNRREWEALAETNRVRVAEVAEMAHARLSRFDTVQLQVFLKTEAGRAMAILANLHAGISDGARSFDIGGE